MKTNQLSVRDALMNFSIIKSPSMLPQSSQNLSPMTDEQLLDLRL